MFLTWDPSRLPWLLPGSELENVSRQGKHCLKQKDSTMLVFFFCKGIHVFIYDYKSSSLYCAALMPKDLSNLQYCRSSIEVVEVGVVVRMEVV